MFGLEEPYLCIKVIFVGDSSVLWLVLGFGFLVEISGENRQTYRNRNLVPVLKVEYHYSKLFWFRGYSVSILKVEYRYSKLFLV